MTSHCEACAYPTWRTMQAEFGQSPAVIEREERLARIAEVYPEAAAEASLAGTFVTNWPVYILPEQGYDHSED